MTLTIGRLAEACGVGSDTIRYYERIGLVEPARRGANGYRHYSDTAVLRVRFIKRAQGLGFSLRDIRALLEFGSTPDATAGDVLAMTRAKIAELNRSIDELKQLVGVLEQLAEACPGQDEPAAECPILDYFSEPEAHHE